MTVQPNSPQMMTVLHALADAAAYRRALVAAWCDRCEATPDGSCPEHLADLAAAETYDALAREALRRAGLPGAPLSGYRVIGVMLETIAEWSDDQVGSGRSTKWVCYQITATARYIAELARQADRGEPIDAPDLNLPDAP